MYNFGKRYIHNKYSQLYIVSGIGLAKTVLVPEYKKRLNEYGRDAGNVAELLLNRAQVQMLLKGNTTNLDVFQKVLDTADVKIEGVVNDLNIIKQFAKVMQKRSSENKFTSFLLSLKSAIDGDNHGGTYFGNNISLTDYYFE